MSTVKVEPLTQENYETWRIQAEAVLIKNDAWSYVDGSVSKPTEPEEAKKWEIGDAKAKSDLILAISPSELRHLRGCKTSRNVWQKLESIHASKGPAKKATLLKELLLHKMEEGGDVREHVMHFFEVKNKLADMEIHMHDDLVSIMLLYSLPSSFENFRCAIESRDTLPDPETLKVKIIEEVCSRRQTGSEEKALLVKSKIKKPFKPKSGASKTDFKYKCFKCHKHGHKASECDMKKNKDQCRDSAKYVLECDLQKDNFNLVTFNCIAGDKAACNGNGGWVIDSGCTSHLCNDPSKFGNSLIPLSGKLNLAINSSTDVKGKGTVKLITCGNNSKTIVELPDTLFVPNLRCNLISVARITNKGYSVKFDKNIACVRDSYGNTMLVANRRGNLYYVEEQMGTVSIISETVDKVRLWHERLGHLNGRDLVKLLNKSGMNIKMTDVSKLYNCGICASRKMNASSFSRTDGPCDEKLRIIYSDVVGPMRYEAIGGAKYFITFIDDSSRWCEVYLLSKKSEALKYFKIYKSYVENLTGKRIKYMQTDNGGEFCNKDFNEYLQTEGIRRRLTIPNTPQQNGVAERMNRTLVEMARCMIISSNLSPGFWGDAVMTACHVRNRCPTSSLEGGTPYEKWYERPANINYMQVFGNKIHVLDKEEEKDKFAPRSREGIFVGYPRDRKGYKIWLPQERKYVVSRDVKFHTNETRCDENNSSITDPLEFGNEELQADICRRPEPNYVEIDFHAGKAVDNTREVVTSPRRFVPEPERNAHVENVQDNMESEVGPSRHVSSDDVQHNHEEKTLKRAPGRPRLDRGHVGRPKKIYRMVEVEPELQEEFSDCQDFVGNAEVSLRQALSGSEKDEWEAAILSEIRSMIKNDTWDIAKRPMGRAVVGCRYILTTKLNVDKTVKKKARLVAKGYSQRYGIDYHQTFSPVVRLDTIRLLTALAVELGMEIHQLDINTAYLNGKLDEEIYMEIPDILIECLQKLLQVEQKGSNIYERATKMLAEMQAGGDTCRLKRSLYGLKQAGRQWNARLDTQLQKMGMRSSLNEPCLYFRDIGEGTKLFVAVYVDDILVASQERVCIENFKKELASEFDLKDYGVAKYMLGIDIERVDSDKIKLSQQKYIEDLLFKYGLNMCKETVSTPMEVNLKFKLPEPHTKLEEERYPYRELIGSLMYLSVGTRPDISNSVSKLAQVVNCPSKESWAAAKRILRYLKRTKEYGLVFTKTGKAVQGYSDSDWGGCLLDRRSYSGYAFVLGGACMSWKSQKQKCVSTSTCESEYISLSSAMKEALYLNSLLTEIGLRKFASITLHVDNTGAIKLANDSVFHSRSKHIDIRHHFIRSVLKENKNIQLVYLSTNLMLADVLTKALPKAKHYMCMTGLGICL